MGGPIVRFGSTPEYWSNWDKVFSKGGKKSGAVVAGPKARAEAKPSKKKAAATAKPAKPTPSKPVASKAAKKAAKKAPRPVKGKKKS